MTRWDVCVHEAGHVVTGFHLSIPVMKAIAFRSPKAGQNLGETVAFGGYKVQDSSRVAWCMGGHVAERIINGRPFPDWLDTSPDYVEAQQYRPDTYNEGLILVAQLLGKEKKAVLRVAELLRDHRGWCSAARLKAAAGK